MIKILKNLGQFKSSKDISLIITDLDGTLSYNGRISQANISATKDFLNKDPSNHMVIASARPQYSLKNAIYQTELGELVEDEKISLCAFNGLLLYHKGKLISDHPLPVEVINDVRSKTMNSELILFHAADKTYANIPYRWTEWHEKNLNYEFSPIPEDFNNTKLYLIEMIRRHHKDYDSVLKEYATKNQDIKYYSFKTSFDSKLPETVIDLHHILSAKMNKGTALNKYIKFLGISPNKVMVLGDNMNDYDSLIYPEVNSVVIGGINDDFKQKLESTEKTIYHSTNPDVGFAKTLDKINN